MALTAIQQQNIQQRCLRSSFLAIRKNKLEEAFDYIAKFHEDFCEKIGEDCLANHKKDEVYALSTQFFQVTNTNKDCNEHNT